MAGGSLRWWDFAIGGCKRELAKMKVLEGLADARAKIDVVVVNRTSIWRGCDLAGLVGSGTIVRLVGVGYYCDVLLSVLGNGAKKLILVWIWV